MTEREHSPRPNRIIGLFPELLGVGGVQEAGRLTAAALHEIGDCRGWPLDLLSLNDPPGIHAAEVGERRISFQGFGRAKLGFVLSAMGRARHFAKGRDLIVLAAHPNLAFPAAWMRSVSPGLKTVVMSHGIEVWKPLPILRRGALLQADLVLAPSGDTARKLAGVQGVSPERIRTLAWPLNPDFLRLASTSEGLPLPPAFPPQGRVILAVGRWAASERYKGADELVRAVQQLRATVPGLHLVAVGGGDDLPRLHKLAAELGVEDGVHFLTGLSREQIAACYARADVFALPSTGEGFGLVFLEAMAFAKPVVGAACGGTTDLVEDEVNGLLVAPRDTEGLVQALGRLLGDDVLRAKLGRHGAQLVQQKYQFAVFQAELEKILGEFGR